MSKSASASTPEIECKSAEEATEAVARTIARLQPVRSRLVRVGRRLWLRAWLEAAAIEGGPTQAEDVVDHLFTLPSPASAA